MLSTESTQRAQSFLKEIMGENFPNLKKESDIQVQEAWRASNKMNPKRSIPRHIISKVSTVKEKILKAVR